MMVLMVFLIVMVVVMILVVRSEYCHDDADAVADE